MNLTLGIDEIALIFLAVGCFALWAEVFAPDLARRLGRWVWRLGPPAGRISRITGIVGCFLAALYLMDLLPEGLHLPLLVAWLSALFLGASRDKPRFPYGYWGDAEGDAGDAPRKRN